MSDNNGQATAKDSQALYDADNALRECESGLRQALNGDVEGGGAWAIRSAQKFTAAIRKAMTGDGRKEATMTDKAGGQVATDKAYIGQAGIDRAKRMADRLQSMSDSLRNLTTTARNLRTDAGQFVSGYLYSGNIDRLGPTLEEASNLAGAASGDVDNVMRAYMREMAEASEIVAGKQARDGGDMTTKELDELQAMIEQARAGLAEKASRAPGATSSAAPGASVSPFRKQRIEDLKLALMDAVQARDGATVDRLLKDAEQYSGAGNSALAEIVSHAKLMRTMMKEAGDPDSEKGVPPQFQKKKKPGDQEDQAKPDAGAKPEAGAKPAQADAKTPNMQKPDMKKPEADSGQADQEDAAEEGDPNEEADPNAPLKPGTNGENQPGTVGGMTADAFSSALAAAMQPIIQAIQALQTAQANQLKATEKGHNDLNDRLAALEGDQPALTRAKSRGWIASEKGPAPDDAASHMKPNGKAKEGDDAFTDFLLFGNQQRP